MRKARNTVSALENLGMLTLLLLLLCLIIVTVDNINKSITAYVNPTATAVINPTPTVDPEMGIAVYATCRDGTMKKVSENTCQYNDGVKLYHYQGPPGTRAVMCNNKRVIFGTTYPSACDRFQGFYKYISDTHIHATAVQRTIVAASHNNNPTPTPTVIISNVNDTVFDEKRGEFSFAICNNNKQDTNFEDTCKNDGGVRKYYYKIPANASGVTCNNGQTLNNINPSSCDLYGRGGFSNYSFSVIQPTSTPRPTLSPASTIRNNSNQSGQRIGARCNNGTFHDVTGRGACTRRGGVAEWVYAP